MQHVAHLANSRVVLASASPRRHEILASLGLALEVVPSTFAEDLDKADFASPSDYAEATARHKALEVAARVAGPGSDPALWPKLVVAADTVVALGSRVMEKPRSEANAREMLRALSGRQHTVHTGVALVAPGGAAGSGGEGEAHATRFFHEVTKVDFCEASDALIDFYVKTGEPMDKAGAYGIQGLGGSLVRRIEGCFYNVMGLPLHRFCAEVEGLVLEGKLILDR